MQFGITTKPNLDAKGNFFGNLIIIFFIITDFVKDPEKLI